MLKRNLTIGALLVIALVTMGVSLALFGSSSAQSQMDQDLLSGRTWPTPLSAMTNSNVPRANTRTPRSLTGGVESVDNWDELLHKPSSNVRTGAASRGTNPSTANTAANANVANTANTSGTATNAHVKTGSSNKVKKPVHRKPKH